MLYRVIHVLTITFITPGRSNDVAVGACTFPLAVAIGVMSASRFSIVRFLSGLIAGIGVGNLIDPLMPDWVSPEGLLIGVVCGLVFWIRGRKNL